MIDCVVVGPIRTNCWLYPFGEASQNEYSCVVIDPGDNAELIVSRLRELNWVPRFIFLSHGHFDHVTALPGLIEAFEKGAFEKNQIPKIGIHKNDLEFLEDDAPQADIFFEDGQTIGPFRILHIPGHTQGSVGFYDEAAGVLFSGDTLFKRGYGRTDLPGGNEVQIKHSIKRLLSMNEEIKVYPGHGQVTTIRDEAKLWGS
jgi:glyoxylase-like metal-dependent hydrolase (beta-lactamase superfamily II)